MRSFPPILILVAISFFLTDSSASAGNRGKADLPPARRPHDGLPPGHTDHAARTVDDYLSAYWTRESVTPAPRINDAKFLRRASLALNGIAPTAGEVLEFLDVDSLGKREDKVEELLSRSRYADYWGFRFRDWVTQIREVKGQSTNLVTLYYYGRQAMAENRSWARIANDLLATDGDVSQHGWANFALYFDTEPNEVADAASRMFLGTNLACAQCHDDPYVEQWKQESYWGMAAFFARTKIRMPKGTTDDYYDQFALAARPPTSVSTLPGGDAAIDGTWGDVRAWVESDKGEAKIPGTEDPEIIMPTPLGGVTIADADEKSETRRDQFVSWIVDPNNPLFARATVNRMWLELTGLGFVDSFDGFSPRTDVRHEELLNVIAQEFAARDYDLKWLMRTIVLSQLFQLEHGTDLNISETWHAVRPRLLNGDQWLDSVVRVTGEEQRVYALADEITPLLEKEHADRVVGVVPWDPRSEQTDASKIARPYQEPVVQSPQQLRLETLRKEYAEIGNRVAHLRERARLPMSPSAEALMSMNGEIVASSLERGTVATEIAKLPTRRHRIEAVFLAVLNRRPSENEWQLFPELAAADSRASVDDLLWTLLQATEFKTY
jgi:hypothetical protein